MVLVGFWKGKLMRVVVCSTFGVRTRDLQSVDRAGMVLKTGQDIGEIKTCFQGRGRRAWHVVRVHSDFVEHEVITEKSYFCAANNHRQKAACFEPNLPL